MKPRIAVTDREVQIASRRLDELRALGELAVCEDDREDTIAAAARDADVILTCYAPITRRIIDGARRLKGIVKYGVGVDSIDLDAASQRRLPVANCPDYGTQTVADHAFVLLMALARRLSSIDRRMRNDGWMWPTDDVLANDVAEKTVGLVGLGRIGRAMARRAQGFDMQVLAHDPFVDQTVFESLGVRQTALAELLRASDFVSLHCVLTPQTQGLLGAAELRQMKPTAYLINVSRGALVEPTALVQALSEKWIAGAGLDVFVDEPLSVSHPLAGRDNVILTPHLAWYTAEALDRIDNDTLEAVRDILAGRVPRNLRNRDLLDRYAAG